MPTKDLPNQITAHVAAAAMFELVALIAARFDAHAEVRRGSSEDASLRPAVAR
jgi:hypothetical protein